MISDKLPPKIYYILYNPWFSKEIPNDVFEDYHEMIVYIRRQKFTDSIIYKFVKEFYDSDRHSVLISESVMRDAWSDFNEIEDLNYNGIS